MHVEAICLALGQPYRCLRHRLFQSRHENTNSTVNPIYMITKGRNGPVGSKSYMQIVSYTLHPLSSVISETRWRCSENREAYYPISTKSHLLVGLDT